MSYHEGDRVKVRAHWLAIEFAFYVGVSNDIIEASWLALRDSVDYFLARETAELSEFEKA